MRSQSTQSQQFLFVGEPFDPAHGPESIEWGADKQKGFGTSEVFVGRGPEDLKENRYLPDSP